MKRGLGVENIKGAVRVILLSALVFTLCSEGFAPSESLAASKTIKLNYKSKSVVAGKEFTLKLRNLKKTEIGKIKYKTKDGKTKTKKGKTYPKITWKSSDPSVAKVKDGKVTAVKYGEAVITAKFKRKKDKKAKTYTCKVKVKRPNYIVDPTTEPLEASNYTKEVSYNSYTQHYYMLRSYVEDLEKRGGGTLTLSPGQYSVTNVVYIPSDTKVYLSDDVTIINANNTHTSKLTATKTVFHFCEPSKARASAKYTGSKRGKYPSAYTGYNGVHNSAIIGSGSATIDMGGVADRYGVLMVHAQNILVQGVAFTNIRNGHGVEVNASANVNIQDCTFTGSGLATSKDDEGVNIDTPDLATGGVNAPYSSYDHTPCQDVTVQGCTFSGLPRAVGSHSYSYGYPHVRINVIGNTIRNSLSNAIGTMNWKDSFVQNNIIDGVKGDGNGDNGKRKGYGISGEGTINLTVTGNTFANMARIADFFAWEEDDYPPIDVYMSDVALNMILSNNTFVNVINVNIKLDINYSSEETFFPPEPEPGPEAA
jgi:hypothetical protein